MRYATFLLFLAACSGSGQSFSSGDDKNEGSAGSGELRVTPEALDFGTVSTTHTGKMMAFGLFNDGEYPLEVIHVKITDSGGGEDVDIFRDLRRADSGEGTNFSLSQGEKMEFTVVGQGDTPMDAVGNIQIYTNDSTIDNGGPGKFQLPMTLSVVPSNDEEQDTGIEDTGIDS